jgi:Sugar (and other) transporter
LAAHGQQVSDTTSPAPEAGLLQTLDDGKITKFQLKIMFVSGMGFFTEFGPNTTTFIYPAEIFPVEVRTTGHGISAGAGKLGAFAGAFLFPDMLASSWGIRGAEIVAGVSRRPGCCSPWPHCPSPGARAWKS